MELGAIGNVAATNVQRIADGGPASSTPVNIPANQTAVQTTNAVQRAVAPPSLDQVKQAVDEINKSMSALSRGLEFSVDEDSQRTVVKIVDQQTSEVIRQIPTEEAIAISVSIDQFVGQLVREKA